MAGPPAPPGQPLEQAPAICQCLRGTGIQRSRPKTRGRLQAGWLSLSFAECTVAGLAGALSDP